MVLINCSLLSQNSKLMYQQSTGPERAVLLRFGAQDDCLWWGHRQVSDKHMMCDCETEC